LLHNLLEIGRSESGCFIGERFQPAESAFQALKNALETHAWTVFEKFGTYDNQTEALEFLATSGISFEVSSQADGLEMDGDYLVIAVSDDGPGIEPENHEMVFQRYAQVKECSIVARKGHGLGLAGANIISRCLGGSLELESEKGKGATFRLTLPLKLASD
jgi:nitrogen-specific signal transduction histidine kinase